MAYSTALDGPGIFSLERVQLFFKKMKLDLSKVIIKQDHFNLEDPKSRDYRRFYDFVNQSKLCPVIAADPLHTLCLHAMVVDKAIQYGTEWYFQCKNTYKDTPKVFVAHLSTHLKGPLITYKPYEAIIISFDKK